MKSAENFFSITATPGGLFFMQPTLWGAQSQSHGAGAMLLSKSAMMSSMVTSATVGSTEK